jgi:uncharacterized protein DUF955
MLTDAAGANERLAWMLDYPDEELDANQFAAAILMPEHLLSHARAATTDPKELAERFGHDGPERTGREIRRVD